MDAIATGCPGKFLRIRGSTAAYCLTCRFYGVQGNQLKPLADMTAPGGEWFCPNKRGFHENDLPPTGVSEHPSEGGTEPPYFCGLSHRQHAAGVPLHRAVRGLEDDS